MIYIIAFLAGYFLFSLPCMYRYFRQSSRIHELEESVHQNNKTIHQLNADLEKAKAKQAEQKSPPPKPTPPPNTQSESKQADLKDEYKRKLRELDYMHSMIIEQQHRVTADLRKFTWDDLWKLHGGKKVFDLNQIDIDTIHYPPFREDKVFYSSYKGKRYHAVSWCYSLDASKNISSCTRDEAVQMSYTPCPICVVPEKYAKVIDQWRSDFS